MAGETPSGQEYARQRQQRQLRAQAARRAGDAYYRSANASALGSEVRTPGKVRREPAPNPDVHRSSDVYYANGGRRQSVKRSARPTKAQRKAQASKGRVPPMTGQLRVEHREHIESALDAAIAELALGRMVEVQVARKLRGRFRAALDVQVSRARITYEQSHQVRVVPLPSEVDEQPKTTAVPASPSPTSRLQAAAALQATMPVPVPAVMSEPVMAPMEDEAAEAEVEAPAPEVETPEAETPADEGDGFPVTEPLTTGQEQVLQDVLSDDSDEDGNDAGDPLEAAAPEITAPEAVDAPAEAAPVTTGRRGKRR